MFKKINAISNNKLFSYMGSKDSYKKLYQEFILKSNKTIYVEPFLGSGIIFLNLPKTFEKYYLAEKDPCLFNLFSHLINKTFNYNNFVKYYSDIDTKYILSSYDGYYLYREEFNKTLWKTNLVEEAYGIIFLTTNCINGMYRFGNNGFTASFGSRFFNSFKLSQVKNVINYLNNLSNIFLFKDYSEVICIKNSIQIVDPPYYLSNLANNYWNETNTKTLVENLNSDNDIIYSDIKNAYGDIKFKNYIESDILKNISPSRKKETLHKEVFYYNF